MLNQIKLKSKKAITKLFDFNYYVSVKWRYFLIKKNLDKQIFVVYSDGKVGSTTMSASLYKNFPDSFVFHVHRLSEKSVDYLEDYYRNRLNQQRIKASQIPDNVIQSKFLLKNLRELSATRRLYIISLVRDPVAGLISEYWDNYPYHKRKMQAWSDREIIDAILTNLSQIFASEIIDLRLKWFENEFNKNLGFDIYKESFDKQKGYHIYSSNKKVIILKLELLDNCIKDAMKDFLSVANF